MLNIANAQVFDGRELLPGRQLVALNGERIESVAPMPGAIPEGAIDVKGMTLMPGMISCHLHADFFKFSLAQGMAGDPLGKEFPPGVMMAIGVRTCRVMLESGFTGFVGASCSNYIDSQLKIAIAEGIIPGPRIRACGHHIGTTGDLNHSKNWWKEQRTPGTDVFFDGPDELRKAVREEIHHGVETIKIFAGSGHGFPSKTNRNMSRQEIKTIVDTAHERAVKVRAHVADKAMIMECVELGVDVIDHGDEVDSECIAAMVEAGTFWVPSLIYPKCIMQMGWGDDKMKSLYDSVRETLPAAQEAGVKILIGDDYSGVFRDVLEDDPLDHQVGCYGREFAYYADIDGLTARDVLSWGTSNAGDLLVDAPAKVGVIEAGALADLILVDGNPLEDLTLLSQPEQSLKAVMRDGQFIIDHLAS